MSGRRCAICHRGPKSSISRSHSMVATKRKQFLNLQTKWVNGKKWKLCTKCLKSGKLEGKRKKEKR